MATLSQRVDLLAARIRAKINEMMILLVPSGGTTGHVLTKLSSGFGWVAPSGGGGGGGGFSLITKTDDENRINNANLTADSELVIDLQPGTYRLRLEVSLTTANATMDYKYATAFTGTSTVKWFRRRHSAAGAVAGTDNENTLTGTGHIPSTAVAATTSGVATVEISLTIVVTTAGQFQFQWAQNTSNGSALTCLEGSTLQYAEV